MTAGRSALGAFEGWGTCCTRSGISGQTGQAGAMEGQAHVFQSLNQRRSHAIPSLSEEARQLKLLAIIWQFHTYNSIEPPLAAVRRASSSVMPGSAKLHSC